MTGAWATSQHLWRNVTMNDYSLVIWLMNASIDSRDLIVCFFKILWVVTWVSRLIQQKFWNDVCPMLFLLVFLLPVWWFWSLSTLVRVGGGDIIHSAWAYDWAYEHIPIRYLHNILTIAVHLIILYNCNNWHQWMWST